MRHAILIIMHSDSEVTKKMMVSLDSEEIDFYIHLDKKTDLPDNFMTNIVRRSKLHILHDINVRWGHSSQLDVTLLLVKTAMETDQYDYYHLISGVDLNLMSLDYFLDFFKSKYPQNFIDFENVSELPAERLDRVKYFYPSLNFALPRIVQRILISLTPKIERVLGIDRISTINDIKFQSGSQWFSITADFVNVVLAVAPKYRQLFESSRASDEMFIQTIFATEYKMKDWAGGNARYIDFLRGHPYVFTKNDFVELKSIQNSGFAFVRKVDVDLSKAW